MGHCVTCFTPLCPHEEPLKQCRECYQKKELSAARTAEAEAVEACIELLRDVNEMYLNANDNYCSCGDATETSCHACSEWMKVERRINKTVGELDAARADLERLTAEP